MAQRQSACANRQGKVSANATSCADTSLRVQTTLNQLTGKEVHVQSGAMSKLKEVSATATAVQRDAEACAKEVSNLRQ